MARIYAIAMSQVPEAQRHFRLFRHEYNALQALERNIDPTHVTSLYSFYDLADAQIG